jgi:protein-tyrosine phosphatase
LGQPKKKDSDAKSVLFVCLGNICRSPTGEGVFLSLLEDLGQTERFVVDSAGTIGYHAGHPADQRMQEAARRRGIGLPSLSRKITPRDLETFDLVIAMDRENLQDIQGVHSEPTAELKLLSDFLDDSWPSDVPDPYYGGEAGFEYVMDMIQAACPGLLKYLNSK